MNQEKTVCILTSSREVQGAEGIKPPFDFSVVRDAGCLICVRWSFDSFLLYSSHYLDHQVFKIAIGSFEKTKSSYSNTVFRNKVLRETRYFFVPLENLSCSLLKIWMLDIWVKGREMVSWWMENRVNKEQRPKSLVLEENNK